MTPEIKRQVWAWIRGAFLGLIGYAAIILLAAGRWDWPWGIVAQPLLLGSWPAWLPAILAVAAYVVRTALEDRTLQAELPGYAAYTRRTRYRLLPGMW